MTRGRKPLPPPAAAVGINEAVVRADLAAADTLAALRQTANENAQALAVQLGYEGSLLVGSLEDEIRFFQRRSVEAVLELGKRLLILRELTPHGEFEQRVELLGIDERMARRFMTTAVKFSKRASTPVLKAAGNQTKLLELLILDDEEIAALGAGESARGITLSKLDIMTVRELREALREARAEAGAKDRVIETQAKRSADLEKRLARVQVQPPDEALAELRAHLSGYAIEVEAALSGRLMPACEALLAHHAAHGGDSREVLEGALRQVERMTASLRAEIGLMGGPARDALKAVA